MKKLSLCAFVLALCVMMMTTISCDNRSQMEKDADAAAKKVGDMVK